MSRNDSKGKVIDFARLAEARDTWSRLLPQPDDPDVAVDVLHAASGGALKSRAFWAVREMRRHGLWQDEALDRYACVPDGRVRKRAVRMGLIDLPEKADTFADMKAVSRALHAVLRLGEAPDDAFDLPVSTADTALRGLRRGAHGRLPHPALPLAARARRRLRRQAASTARGRRTLSSRPAAARPRPPRGRGRRRPRVAPSSATAHVR